MARVKLSISVQLPGWSVQAVGGKIKAERHTPRYVCVIDESVDRLMAACEAEDLADAAGHDPTKACVDHRGTATDKRPLSQKRE